uniref:transketolase n=1 Tax=Coccolithus braarudii TaxID=221442 RepID=A0A7S0LT09_9EUKA|mmetsp:Transcript_52255/g.111754  ORF Transcript_52255/g.111754 Transcript_52255/m.111754 type:complete len:736 (+) Transcript_52255:181-2388(+)
MDRVLQYNFGYLPPRNLSSSSLPLSTLLANKRAIGSANTNTDGQLKPAKKGKTDAQAEANAAVERRCVNYVRVLGAEMVQNANSGHPGAAMGCAPMAHVLWSRFMNFDPKEPKWINRDRFVLSNGHACPLLYAMLHLTGYDISIEDLQRFRQLDSLTPGHPENHVTPGVEVSTGPLGQGISNGVGLAMAQAHLGATFNREGYSLIDNTTFVICGDGCLQEGISSEASSLAGHLRLGKLIVLWDDNKIQIDGSTELAFTEDVVKRYDAYGWHTITVNDGDSSLEALDAAISRAKDESSRPTLIKVSTTIGYGSAKEGTEKVHGAPLGHADLANLKKQFGFDEEQFFAVPDDVATTYRACGAAGSAKHAAWRALFAAYSKEYPELAADFLRRESGELPEGWKAALPSYTPADKALATRQSSQQVLNKLAEAIPDLVGGSADLTPSNLTKFKGALDFQASSPEGRYIRFGVREHAMAALCNGMCAYGMLRPFCATFLNFIGYAAGAVRVSALSHLGVIYIATHDSIGLGEDGPTHQPIEMLLSLRATPNLLTIRPADANEVAGAYMHALESPKTPTVIALSRQGCANLHGSAAEKVLLGGYVLPIGEEPPCEEPQLVLVGSGSEVQTLLAAAPLLAPLRVRLVSMPCWELFDAQPTSYKQGLFPRGVPVLAMEALTAEGWCKYAHQVIGMRTFGASGPAKDVQKRFGFTTDTVVTKAKELMAFFKDRPVPCLLDRPDL